MLADGERWKLIEGDCLEAMRGMEAGSVDLIVADPPYFKVKDAEWDWQWDKPADFLSWIGQLCDEWRRVLKPNGSLYCFASPQMAWGVEGEIRKRFNVLNQIRWMKEDGWAKRQCKEEQRAYFPAREDIIFAEQHGADESASGQAGYGAKCDELHKRVYAPVIGSRVQQKRMAAGLERHEVDTACAPSRKPTGLCYRWEEGACLPTLEQWVSLCRLCGDGREYEDLRREYEDLRREYEDLRRPFTVTADVPYTDVWDFATVGAYAGKHPCEKPRAMLAHIVKASSRQDAVVLDPFAGSGVLGEVCVELGRRYVGIEKCPRWADQCRDRISIAEQAEMFLATADDATMPTLFA